MFLKSALLSVRYMKYTIILLGYGGEDAESSTKLLDGSSGFKPAVPLLLLGLEELITEMFPLLRGERAQDPAAMESQVGISGNSSALLRTSNLFFFLNN